MIKLQLVSDSPQSLLVNLPLYGRIKRLRLDIKYNRVADYYTVSVSDVASGKLLIDNVPLVRNEGDSKIMGIFDQMFYLEIGSVLVIKSDDSEGAPDSPAYRNFTQRFNVFWG